MKVIDCEQGSPEWHAARAGRVTSSRVADVVRQTKNGPSATRETYKGELIAERLSGFVATDGYVSTAMQRGIETEDKARAYYGFINDVQPERVGFVLHPTIEMAGCSPDRLVLDDGLIEIKCPHSKEHIRMLKGGAIEADYAKQIQWQLACTGRAWCDFISYDDRLPPEMCIKVIRVHRDVETITALELAVRLFLAEIEKEVAELRSMFKVAA